MTLPYEAIWWVLGLPLIGFLIQALLGARIVRALGPASGKRLMGALAVLPIAAAFLIGVGVTMTLGAETPGTAKVVTLFDWIRLASLSVPFEFRIDSLSMTMVLIITGIGALIHLYATGYMAEEKDYPRFFTYLNLFIAAMLVLVLGNNLVLMFIGWEGVGLCSYLLIGFWYKDLANARAANKAFIVNRIGDWGLMLGMFLIFAVIAGTMASGASLPVASDRLLSYDVILANFEAVFADRALIVTIIALLLFVGAAGKSAQFPLYLWLPDAMAGPTPVSALIHAATMVTAGVFMLNRLHPFFAASPVASAVVAVIGAFTALFAAVIAFGQTDIKKVLAYSTVSQLGFMFIACGAGVYWAGMFHVTTHAFFKALLFLGAGAVIHAMAHNQDLRNYGNLLKYLKITGATMIVGWIAIAGIPPLAGFWSKESILGAALANEHASSGGINFSAIAGWTGLFVAMLTAWYMTRMTWLTFFGKEERWRAVPAEAHSAHHAHNHESHVTHEAHGPDEHSFFYTDDELLAEQKALAEHEDHHHELNKEHTPHEVPPSMWVPLVVLAALSLGGGWYLAQGERFQKWLYPNGAMGVGSLGTHPHDGLAAQLMWLSIGAATLGILLGFVVYRRGLPAKEGWDDGKWSPFRRSARDQFGYDDAMVQAAVEGGGDLGDSMWRGFDSKVVDGLVNGAGALTAGVGSLFRRLQTGYVRSYALLMLAGAVVLIGYVAMQIAKMGGGQ